MIKIVEGKGALRDYYKKHLYVGIDWNRHLFLGSLNNLIALDRETSWIDGKSGQRYAFIYTSLLDYKESHKNIIETYEEDYMERLQKKMESANKRFVDR